MRRASLLRVRTKNGPPRPQLLRSALIKPFQLYPRFAHPYIAVFGISHPMEEF